MWVDCADGVSCCQRIQLRTTTQSGIKFHNWWNKINYSWFVQCYCRLLLLLLAKMVRLYFDFIFHFFLSLSLTHEQTQMCHFLFVDILFFFSTSLPQIKRDPHHRIVYRPYDTLPAISSMEIKSSSPLLQKLFQTLPTKYKYHQQHQSPPQQLQTLNVTCEVSILHVYHSSAHANLIMINPGAMSSSSSHIPNLFNPEKAIGDPDNSPLTGGCSAQPNVYYVIFLIFCCFFFGFNSILWHICCI